MLSGCAVSPVTITDAQFIDRARQDLAVMFSDQEPVTGPLTFNDVLVRSLSYNLDRRSKMMEEALALGQLDLDRFNLLPSIVASAGYDNRSEINASTSRDLITQQANDVNPTYSSDRDTVTAELGMTWNILDFGVSYYVAKQNADRALIAAERRRRTVQNLVQEVRFAFWKAAAAQFLKDAVAHAVAEAENALADAERMEQERLRNPATSLQTQKTLLQNIRQLEAIDQELSSAQAELSALMAMPPGVEYVLDTGGEMVIPNLVYPIERMEEMALANNPEVREHDYLGRISINETRKEIVKLLPGISLSFSRQYDSNSFLAHNRWTQAGAAVTWNLLNVFSAPDRIEHAEAAEEVARARRLALRMAVLAQVHVGKHQLNSAIRQFGHADRLWEIESRLLTVSRNQQTGGAQSPIERVTMETSAIVAQLRRYSAFARVQAAFGKMQATLGLDPNPTMLEDAAVVNEGSDKDTVVGEQTATPTFEPSPSRDAEPETAVATVAEAVATPSRSSEAEEMKLETDVVSEPESITPPPPLPALDDVAREANVSTQAGPLTPLPHPSASDDTKSGADTILEPIASLSLTYLPGEVKLDGVTVDVTKHGAHRIAPSGLNAKVIPEPLGKMIGIALRCEEVTAIDGQWGLSQIKVASSVDLAALEGWSDERIPCRSPL